MIARNKAKDWLRAYRGEILELNDDILLIDGDVEHFWQRQWELEESLLGHMKF